MLEGLKGSGDKVDNWGRRGMGVWVWIKGGLGRDKGIYE